MGIHALVKNHKKYWIKIWVQIHQVNFLQRVIFFCDFLNAPWIFKISTKIRISLQKNLKKYSRDHLGAEKSNWTIFHYASYLTRPFKELKNIQKNYIIHVLSVFFWVSYCTVNCKHKSSKYFEYHKRFCKIKIL